MRSTPGPAGEQKARTCESPGSINYLDTNPPRRGEGLELNLLDAQRQSVPVDANCTPRVAASGRRVGTVFVARPTAEIKRAYQELRGAHEALKRAQQQLLHSEKWPRWAGERAIHWVRKGMPTSFELHWQPGASCTVTGSAGQLQQVLMNLLQNALDAATGIGRTHPVVWIDIDVSWWTNKSAAPSCKA